VCPPTATAFHAKQSDAAENQYRRPAALLPHPTAGPSAPAAAKVLSALLDKLRLASAQGRRGWLAVVRARTEKGGA